MKILLIIYAASNQQMTIKEMKGINNGFAENGYLICIIISIYKNSKQ